MKSIFSTDGELERWRYPLMALPVFVAQHAYVAVCTAIWGVPVAELNTLYLLNPLRALLTVVNPLQLLGGVAVMLLAGWMLVALSFRRARSANLPYALAFLAIIPIAQLPVIIALTLLPSIPRPTDIAPPSEPVREANGGDMVQGALAGMAICVASTVFGAVFIGSYGLVLFMIMPIVAGAVAAYVANRTSLIGYGYTSGVVMAAFGLAAVALIGVAIEGAVCIVMASPLMIGLGILGGAIGETSAKRKHERATLTSIAMLPFLFLVEAAFPPKAEFVTIETVDVAASPEEVWQSITHMGEITERPAVPFGWLAYPVAGEIDGEGAGAVRRGVFSTGIAYERVTVWEPGRRLWFDVLSNPPALRELSPYGDIRTPHLNGYFTTAYAHFDIVPLGEGKARLSLETLHNLNLEPAIYWTPIAQWAVRQNKKRVLAHFALQAEAAASTSPDRTN